MSNNTITHRGTTQPQPVNINNTNQRNPASSSTIRNANQIRATELRAAKFENMKFNLTIAVLAIATGCVNNPDVFPIVGPLGEFVTETVPAAGYVLRIVSYAAFAIAACKLNQVRQEYAELSNME
ncbi:hypothetical protein QS306_14550 [Paraburkholderia bonniea]|uniref:hypothetical protein n=1 Tax=Paraburkholderia bonniea TaxID=2152891 RepID=UPI0012923585|nr:hypothetical protein [Paraburkholderia bonniea]WJF91989.1 hypothetical protein QS306_14550 [Paraburkholderia bonniea]WJF95308.1 hypothetical protein QS308_14555 [Paraburkholderia bonniea]